MFGETTRRAAGFGAFGLALGLLLVTVVYLVFTRAHWAQTGQAWWVVAYLAVLLGPAVALALWGAYRNTPYAQT